jgi:hypothetical protein
MATILSFTPRAASASRPPPSIGDAGSVIIFPGVRYERPKDADARKKAMDGARVSATEPSRPKH